MIRRRLIHCVRCDALALFSPLDQSPEYVHEQGNWRVIERDDQDLFIKEHQGHPLEELQPVPDSFISYQNYIEPVKTSYFEATNGRKRFVVKESRKNILDPMTYELIPGKIVLKTKELRIDGATIQRELERLLSPSRLSSEKIQLFVEELERIVSDLSPKDCKRVPFESQNPSVWYFNLDRAVWKKALKASSKFLSEEESRLLDATIRSNFDGDMPVVLSQVEIQIKAEENPKDAGSQIPHAVLLPW
jgi:hypothetical protein